jgi:hypothetical protein
MPIYSFRKQNIAVFYFQLIWANSGRNNIFSLNNKNVGLKYPYITYKFNFKVEI